MRRILFLLCALVAVPAAAQPAGYIETFDVTWTRYDAGANDRPTIVTADAIYPNASGVCFLLNGSSDPEPARCDATGPRDNSQFHMYPDFDIQATDRFTAYWTDLNGDQWFSTVQAKCVGDGCAPEVPEHACIVVGQDNATAIIVSAFVDGRMLGPDDRISVWTPEGVCAGERAALQYPFTIPLWSDNTVTPEKDGFAHNDSIAFKVYNDVTKRTLEGNAVAVTVTDCDGGVCSPELLFGIDRLYAIGQIAAQDGADPQDSIQTAIDWSPIGYGSYAPIATIADEFYPNPFGVSFYIDGVLNNVDRTGPRDETDPSRTWQVWPPRNFQPGSELMATWRDYQGQRRWASVEPSCQGAECDPGETYYIELAAGDTLRFDSDMILSDTYYVFAGPPVTLPGDTTVVVERWFQGTRTTQTAGSGYEVYDKLNDVIVDSHNQWNTAQNTASEYLRGHPEIPSDSLVIRLSSEWRVNRTTPQKEQ